MLPPEQNRPGYPTRVLALQEERLGLAALEAEDLAVTTDVEGTLHETEMSASAPYPLMVIGVQVRRCGRRIGDTGLRLEDATGGIPFQGRFSGR